VKHVAGHRTALRREIRLCLPALSPVSGRAGHPMPDQLLGYLIIFPVLAAIASLVKNERRFKRYLLKHPRRRRKVLRQPVLT